jgi:hypothetical protein
MPIEKLWSFVCYRNEKKEVVVFKWISGLSVKAKNNALRQMEILLQQPQENWHKPLPASKIKGYNHIYVIRFNDENRTQWRIYGFHNQIKKVFVMTNYGTERDGKYKPTPAACADISKQCMEECNSNWDKYVCKCITNLHNINTFSIADECTGSKN